MGSSKTLCMIAHLDVFERSVACLVGDLDEALEKFRLADNVPRGSIREIRGVIRGMKIEFAGITVYTRFGAVIYLPAWHSLTLVHELWHATRHILKSLAIKYEEAEETGACIMDFLFRSFVDTRPEARRLWRPAE